MIAHLMQKEQLNAESCSKLNQMQQEELERGLICLDRSQFDALINMLESFIPDGANDALQVKMYNYMLQAIRQQEMERIQTDDETSPDNSSLIKFGSNANKSPIMHQNYANSVHHKVINIIRSNCNDNRVCKN